MNGSMRKITNLNNLRTLDLSRNRVRGAIPASIGELSRLTLLKLNQNLLGGPIPESLCQCSKLMCLNLSNNTIECEFPPWITMLKNLTVLSLANNRIGGDLPQDIGELKFLKSLILYGNRITGNIPNSLCEVENLMYIYLDDNYLTGEVPLDLLSLPFLRVLYLSGNRHLEGVFPEYIFEKYTIEIDGTQIVTEDEAGAKQLTYVVDYYFIITYILICYADLLFSVFSVMAMMKEGYIKLFGASIAFIGLNFILGILNTPNFTELGCLRAFFLNLLQFHTLHDGLDTMKTGHRHKTSGYINFKQVDVVVRSIPSMIAQLYCMFLMLTRPELPERSYITMKIAIVFGMLSSALTLTSLETKFDGTYLTKRFLLNFMYFLSEIMVRILTVIIMCVCLDGAAFSIIGIELCFRYFSVLYDGPNMSVPDAIIMTILNLGSDRLSFHDRTLNLVNWRRGAWILTCELLVFLLFINLNVFESNDRLHRLRTDFILENITITSCLCWSIKTYLYHFITTHHHRPSHFSREEIDDGQSSKSEYEDEYDDEYDKEYDEEGISNSDDYSQDEEAQISNIAKQDHKVDSIRLEMMSKQHDNGRGYNNVSGFYDNKNEDTHGYKQNKLHEKKKKGYRNDNDGDHNHSDDNGNSNHMSGNDSNYSLRYYRV